MTTKKVTKKTKPRNRQQSAREIAEHVAAIIAHPDCPEELYDDIVRTMQSMNSDATVHANTGYVEAILLVQFERERKGGAR